MHDTPRHPRRFTNYLIPHRSVETYFRCDPCASRIFHRGSFLASLNLPPTHPDFPHSAILHAMCASASRWTSQELQFASQPKRRDRFAEFHAAKARSYIDRTMSSGAQIFSVLQACIILSWWFYAEGRWVEVWIFAGFQCRAAIPLGVSLFAQNLHVDLTIHRCS